MKLRKSIFLSLPFVFFACGEPQPEWDGGENLVKAFFSVQNIINKADFSFTVFFLSKEFEEALAPYAPQKSTNFWWQKTFCNFANFLFPHKHDKTPIKLHQDGFIDSLKKNIKTKEVRLQKKFERTSKENLWSLL